MALTQEMLEKRRSGIGGSDCAAILGLSKWKTPLEVYLDKVLGSSEKELDNQYIEWGNKLEPVIIKAFEEKTGLKCEIEPNMLRHPVHDFMLANIDARIVGQNAILECKTAGQFMAKEWSEEGGDKLPEAYMLQCAHYAEVCDIDTVYVAVLIGGSTFRIYHYTRDRKLGDAIIKAESNFWNNHVLKKIPPNPIHREDCLKLYQLNVNENAVIADPKIKENICKISELKQTIKRLDVEIKDIQLEIFDCMKDSAILTDESGNKLATWKVQVSNRFDATVFKKENPDLYTKYVKQLESRVFKINGVIE